MKLVNYTKKLEKINITTKTGVNLMKYILLFCICIDITYGSDILQNNSITNGALRDITLDKLCAKNYHTSEDRHTSQTIKNTVYKLYNIDKNSGICVNGCVIDHLISLELGGSDTIENLWPQPKDQAKRKDKLENKLHKLVCNNELDLKVAQDMIATDWISVYIKYFGEKQ